MTVYFSSVADDEHWQNLMSCLVNECLCTADIVAPVITSESPEGFTSHDTQGNLHQIYFLATHVT